MAIRDFVRIRKRKSWGYILNGFLLPILVLVLDHFEPSNTPRKNVRHLAGNVGAERMVGPSGGAPGALLQRTRPTGWLKTKNSTTICRAKRSEGFKALGTCITFDNSNAKEIQHRIVQSWKAFGSHCEMLINTRSSVKRRLELVNKVVISSISWGGATWNFTRRHLQAIHINQNKMIKPMLRIRMRKR